MDDAQAQALALGLSQPQGSLGMAMGLGLAQTLGTSAPAPASLPSPMDSPTRDAELQLPRLLSQAQNQNQQQQGQGQTAATSAPPSLPTPSSSPPSLQHLLLNSSAAATQSAQQTSQHQQQQISNADLLKYLSANGLNPADLEAVLRQRAYIEQQQAQLALLRQQQDLEIEEKLARRLDGLDVSSSSGMGMGMGGMGGMGMGMNGMLGGASSLEEQRWLRQQGLPVQGMGLQASQQQQAATVAQAQQQQQQQHRLQQEALLRLHGRATLDDYDLLRPNVTPPEGYVCKLCFVEGHFLRHCPLYKERPRERWADSVPPENYLCKLCFIPGHWMKNCALYKERAPLPPSTLAAYRSGLAKGASLALHYRSHQQPQPARKFATVPPDGYVCKICGVPGHWIQQCPLKHSQPPPNEYRGLLGERMAERLLA